MFASKLCKLHLFIYCNVNVLDMGRFVGRKKELSFLEDFCSGTGRKVCAVIGRRQIGKSSLIDEFLRGRDHIKFEFAKSILDVNLRIVSRVMSETTGTPKQYNDPMDFLWDLADHIKGKRTIVVFDEFTYMADCCEEFPALTQYFVDMQLGDSKLIISGSSISSMEYQVKDYSSPLYGRATTLYLHGMSLEECAEFHPNMAEMEQLKLYMAVGGVPLYHVEDGQPDFRSYMEEMLLSPQAPFREEGEQMIFRELSPAEDYIRMLDSMRGRRNEISVISSRTGLDRNLCSKRLENLMSLWMVSESHPMWGAVKKPKYYSISDNMLATFFLVKRNDTAYGASPSERFNALALLFSTARGHMFELFCMDLLCKVYPVREIGSWWGSGPDTDRWGNPRLDDDGKEVMKVHDIDIAAEVMAGNNLVNLAVECKFGDRPVGFEALNELESAVGCLKMKRHTRKMLISPSGFTDELREHAEANGILLVDMDIIMGRRPFPQL